MAFVFKSNSAEETKSLGYALGKSLPPNSLLCLFGDLGAGKTTFVKGLASGMGVKEEEVNSPTFVYLNIYQGNKTLYHFDLYRLGEPDEFLSMGFDEYFFAGGICCVEWSEKIEALLPAARTEIRLEHTGEGARKIVMVPGIVT